MEHPVYIHMGHVSYYIRTVPTPLMLFCTIDKMSKTELSWAGYVASKTTKVGVSFMEITTVIRYRSVV